MPTGLTLARTPIVNVSTSLPRAAMVACLMATACSSVPEGRSAVDEVEIVGAEAVSADELLEAIATKENPRFLGLFEGVIYEYSLFDESILERDLARIERAYRQRGFYDAHVRAGRIRPDGDDEVYVQIEVEEGEPVLVQEVTLDGLDGLAGTIILLSQIARFEELPKGEPFDERAFERVDERITNVLHDHGHPWAEVRREADVDLVAHTARITLRAAPGPRAELGEVTVSGLGELPEAPLRGALDLDPGDRYDHSELVRAQQDALNLGLFSSVEIVPDLSDRPDDVDAMGTIPVHVEVTPADLRTVRLGVGVGLDAIQSDVHLSLIHI